MDPREPDGTRTTPGLARVPDAASASGSGAVHAPAFAPGQLLAGRFRIVRFLAQGGMGEVYEAEDLELREHVALKTVRVAIAGEARSIERFKREVHLARKVTHPNVCRIFDVFHHAAGSGTEITFLTMELLEGETFSMRLRRSSPMAPAEALPIAAQMCAGLAAAHKAGVVHRDFKGQNVILVPSQDEPTGVRAVITDFGLARGGGAGQGLGDSVSHADEIVGTPTYMAPEQVEGGAISPATDIYALGILLYEAVTGAPPFLGDSPLSTALKRLKEPPPPPRTRVPGLPPEWEAAILRCLERRPADRFASATDVLKALQGEAVAASRSALARSRRRLAFGTLAAVLLAATVSWQLVSRRDRQTTQTQAERGPAAAPVKPRRSVAVLGFKNLSGRLEAAWLSTAISEMLRTELAAGEQLRTVPGENVARMKLELTLADADSLAHDTLSRIRTNLGADLVVLGSYVALGERAGGQIRLDLKVQDAAAGETIASVASVGTEAQLFDLIATAGVELRRRLGVGTLSAADSGVVRASFPQTPSAARLFSEGLERLRLFDALGARERLEAAVAAEPDHPLARSALAAAWSALGYDARAREEAKRAFDLSARLSREERLLVEGSYRQTLGERDKAVEIYKSLSTFFPDNLDYGLRLAGAQAAGGKGRDALATLEALRGAASPAPTDPRIDLAEAAAAESLSDFKRQKAAAAKAAGKAQAQGARLLLARARISEGTAEQSLGETQPARGHFEDARRIYDAAGDREGVALALHSMGNLLKEQGELAGARKAFEESLAARRQIGNRRGVAVSLNSLANVLSDQGDRARARTLYEESLAGFREVGDTRGVARSLNNIGLLVMYSGDLKAALAMFEEFLSVSRGIGERSGIALALNNVANVHWLQGRMPEATRAYEESLAVYREIGEKSGVAMTLNNLGEIALARADPADARKRLEEMLSVTRGIGHKSLSAYALLGLGETLLGQGDIGGARRRDEEALALWREVGEQSGIALGRIGLSRVALEEGHPETALGLAREACEEFRREKAVDYEAFARAAVAAALVAQGNAAEGDREAREAMRLFARSTNRVMRFAGAITAARARAAAGDRAEALRALRDILAEARVGGFVTSELEARLALGELELASGRAADGRAGLAAVGKDAASRGMGLLARKAAAAGERVSR